MTTPTQDRILLEQALEVMKRLRAQPTDTEEWDDAYNDSAKVCNDISAALAHPDAIGVAGGEVPTEPDDDPQPVDELYQVVEKMVDNLAENIAMRRHRYGEGRDSQFALEIREKTLGITDVLYARLIRRNRAAPKSGDMAQGEQDKCVGDPTFPIGCYNVRCQLGKKCVRPSASTGAGQISDAEIERLWLQSQYDSKLGDQRIWFARAVLAAAQPKGDGE